MKVSWKTTNANIANAAVQMENQYFLLTDILPLAKNAAACLNGANTDFYLSIDKLVQSAGVLIAGVFTASSSYQVLDNSNIDVYKGFNGTSTTGIEVAKFVKGTTYLIPVSQYAVLSMIPEIKVIQYGGELYNINATKYLFQCVEDTELLNDNTVSGVITVQFLGDVAVKAEQMSTQKKLVRGVKMMATTGVDGSSIKQLMLSK